MEVRYGLHNIKMSTAIVKDLINQFPNLEIIDFSWEKDFADSIGIDDYDVQIFLPNSLESNISKELFSHYTIICENSGIQDDFYTFHELVEELKKYEQLKHSI